MVGAEGQAPVDAKKLGRGERRLQAEEKEAQRIIRDSASGISGQPAVGVGVVAKGGRGRNSMPYGDIEVRLELTVTRTSGLSAKGGGQLSELLKGLERGRPAAEKMFWPGPPFTRPSPYVAPPHNTPSPSATVARERATESRWHGRDASSSS